MLHSVQSQFSIGNYSIDFITLPVSDIENRLRLLLPKVDRGSNWFGAIGIFISVALGIASYFCTDVNHRPSLGLTIALSVSILGALGFAVYLLYKSYNAIGVEKIMEELKKDSSQFEIRPNREKTESVKDKPKVKAEQTNQPNTPAIIFKPQGIRKKKQGKKHHR